MMEVGLYDYWMKQEKEKLSYDKYEAKNILTPSTKQKKPIKLSDMASAMIVLGIGILISGFTFIMELAINRYPVLIFCPVNHRRSLEQKTVVKNR